MLENGKSVYVRLVVFIQCFISLLLFSVLAALRSYNGNVTGEWGSWRSKLENLLCSGLNK
jgi:hypothetical protein